MADQCGFDRLLLTRLALATLIATSVPAYGREFRELPTDNFVIYSALSERDTRTFADDISSLEAVVALISSVKDFRPTVAPMRLYALSNADWRKYVAPRDNVAGIHVPAFFDRYIVYDAEAQGGREIALHEYVHYVVSNTGKVYPAWFNEGLAEALKTIEQTPKSIRVGIASHGVGMASGQRKWVPIERLLRIKSGDKEFIDDETQPMVYAESWALVHMYLMTETTPLMEYIRRIGPSLNADIDGAFNTSFGMSPTQMNEKVRVYLQAGKHNVLTIQKGALPELPPNKNPIRKLSSVESDYQLAEMSLAVGMHNDQAQALFESIVQRDPQHRAAWSGLAAAHFAQDHVDKGNEALAKAMAGGTQEAVVLRRAASRAYREDSSRTQGLTLYRQALANDPNDLRTIVEYGNATLRSGDDREEALRYVSVGLRSAPKNWVLANLYASLMTALGRADQARGAWQVVARYTSNDRLREFAQRALERTSAAVPKSN